MEDENVNSGLLFRAEADEVGLMLVVMGLEKSSKYFIRVEEFRHVFASLGLGTMLSWPRLRSWWMKNTKMLKAKANISPPSEEAGWHFREQ